MFDTQRYLRSARPAGPPLPVWVQTLCWGVRPIATVEACARRYGDCFTVRITQGHDMTYVNRPAAVRDLTALSADDYVTAEEQRPILEPFLGPNSLLVLDGDEHPAQRKIVARAFHTESFDAQQEAIAEATARAIASWPRGRPVRTHKLMQALTLEVILRSLFAVPAASLDDLMKPLAELLAMSGNVALLIEPLRRLPGVPWKRFQQLRHEIDGALVELVRERRLDATPQSRPDVLTALARTTDEQGALLPEAVVRDHVLTLLLAGHDTTATALAWTCDLLAHHRVVADRLADECAQGEDTYLDAVIKEVLRVRPIIPEVGRRILRPMVIGNVPLPARTNVSVSTYLLHRHPDIYEDAERFFPERFLDRSTDPNAWIPFGFGARRCVGLAFAMLEMRAVLRTVVPALSMTPTRARLESPRRRAVTLIPRHGAPVVFEAR